VRVRTALLGLVLVGGAVAAAAAIRDHTPLRSEFCVAEVGETRARVDLEQAQWSSLMAAQAQTRGLPPRATTIAIATAFQESKIHNIDYGDRDSVGLFQQRPSQGWGTVEQIMDPQYSIAAFYDGLQEIEGYESMEITVAAQAVQRSAFPDAYAQHEAYSRALASSLRGFSPAAFSCQLNPSDGGSVEEVRADLEGAFGAVDLTPFERRIVLDVPGADAEARQGAGWAYAHYLVANAAPLGLDTVEFDGRRWSAETSTEGWAAHDSSDEQVVTHLR
jgi:hypothetical protein